MYFSSLSFLVFLSVVVLINTLISGRQRIYFLLTCSIFFIGWFSFTALLFLLVMAAVTWLFARMQSPQAFYVGIGLNVLGILFQNYLLYQHSVLSLEPLTGFVSGSTMVLLGLSFYALQNISWLLARRWGALREYDFVSYLHYISFFPKIASGPLSMPADFLEQGQHNVGRAELYSGGQRFLLGLSKKLVLADPLAAGVASVFDQNDYYSGSTVSLAALLFTIQLYFDFSAYCDMAIGAARMLGIRLPENFDTPLRSRSISEFWRRWHITLIGWFTANIYYPIAFRLRTAGTSAAFAAIFATFIVSALWHGTAVTFLLWGACHIVYLSTELLFKKTKFRIGAWTGIPLVLVAVSFSHIFFRAPDLARAGELLSMIFRDFLPASAAELFAPLAVGWQQADQFNFIVLCSLSLAYLLFEKRITAISCSKELRPAFVIVCLLLILLAGSLGSSGRFIYMQF